MRKFSFVLELPESCECCGSAIKGNARSISAGTYKLEMPEGELPTELRLGSEVRICLGNGKLRVELRQRRTGKGVWDLWPFYPTQAFGLAQRESFTTSEAEGGATWHVFSFGLQEYKPHFTDWCAEMTFAEYIPLTYCVSTGGKVVEASSAKLTVKLESLK